jgi:hypothetical protein
MKHRISPVGLLIFADHVERERGSMVPEIGEIIMPRRHNRQR